MKFYKPLKEKKYYHDGDIRIKKKFTLFPYRINDEIYWLQTIYIMQKVRRCYDPTSASEWNKYDDIRIASLSEYLDEDNMNSRCNIKKCEYNEYGKCQYCGDYFSLNDKECYSYVEK